MELCSNLYFRKSFHEKYFISLVSIPIKAGRTEVSTTANKEMGKQRHREKQSDIGSRSGQQHQQYRQKTSVLSSGSCLVNLTADATRSDH